MPAYNAAFVEKTEYVYAVARIRALETRLVNESGYNTLLQTPLERFPSIFAEITGIKSDADQHFSILLRDAEESLTECLHMIKSFIFEDEIKRLISLKYDYHLLKLIIKEEKGYSVTIPADVSMRSNCSYSMLKSLLEGGKKLEAGPFIYDTYLSVRGTKELSGRRIDNACDHSYYAELFQILNTYNNGFLTEHFLREVDTRNILTALRLKVRGEKHTSLRDRYIPFGTIGIKVLEQTFDLGLDGFTSKIILSPLSSVLKQVDKTADLENQVIQLERLFEEESIIYLKRSITVTFGIEPLLTYLWLMEAQVKNLRTILLAKVAGLAAEEVKKYVRGLYG